MPIPARVPLPVRVASLLDRFDVRVVLTLAILASLVPHPHEDVTDLAFFGLFAVELILRCIAIFAPLDEALGPTRIRTAKHRLRTAVLLTLDVVALLTFTPLVSLFASAGWLRLTRLLRLLLLFGYWSPLFRQSLGVLGRQDRLRQVAVLASVALLCAFAGAALLSHLPVDGVDFDGNGVVDASDRGFLGRLWWSFRQVADNGNLVQDPGQIAVVVVSFALTVAGVLVVSFLIGLATDIVRELVEASRDRAPGWRGHTVVVNATPGLPALLHELGAYYERLFRRPRFIVADTRDEPPDGFSATELTRVRWRAIDPRGTELAEKTDTATARRVVVLAKPDALFPDAHLAALVLNVREANAKAWIVAEVLDPVNAAATRVAGGPRTVAIATEQLLALWALAAVRRPEQLPLARDLVASRCGREIYSYYFDTDGLEGPGSAWEAGATTFEDLLRLAFEGGDGAVVPIGVVRADDTPGLDPTRGELVLGPPAGTPLGGRIAAVVAVADHFRSVQQLALRAHAGLAAPSARAASTDPTASVAPPELVPGAAPRRHRAILVGGLRPATPLLCAALLDEEPDATITLVQRHEESLRIARETLLGHGVVASRCAGEFVLRAGGGFGWVRRGERDDGRTRLELVQADWSSERTLRGLEAGVRDVASYDLVVLLGGHHVEYDGRTAMAALKIADLVRSAPERFAPEFSVLTGIADVELGRRLAEGFERACGRRLHVIDCEALRALFVFQAIAVPGFQAIFEDLIGPGGNGLLRLALTKPRPGVRWRFGALALALRATGVVLIALETAAGLLPSTRSPTSDLGLEVDEGELVAVWVVGPEARSVSAA